MTALEINGRRVGPGEPVYVIAEMSANHHQDFDRAVELLKIAKAAGADAVKLQTYTPDTMTIDCDLDWFQVGKGTPWEGRNLYDLYGEAYTPWEWQPRLKEIADGMEMALFSTPFDASSVDFLEGMDVPAYKIASFELVDLPLLRRVAATGKPIIMSTGMATREEIDEAVTTIRLAGGGPQALLKCTSAYPAPAEEMHLRTIPDLAAAFDVPAGLSDHTLDMAVAVAAVALGACIVEKHFTQSRAEGGPDDAFSLEPDELRSFVATVRTAQQALGDVSYGPSEKEAASRIFRRSLFAVQDVKAGQAFTAENVRSIRPGRGLHPRHLEEVVGRVAEVDVARGTPLGWHHVSGESPQGEGGNPRAEP